MAQDPNQPDSPSPGDPAPAAAPRQPPSSRLLRRGIALVLLLLTAGGLAGWWIWSQFRVRTNNAYVVGNITPVSAEISGKVVALYADDNMIVKAGDALAQVDPVPLQLAVDQALADLRQLRAQERAAEVSVRLVRQDRKSLLEGAMARRSESDQQVRAAGVEVQTRGRIHEKEKELLESLRARLPGLVAMEANARDYFARFSRLAASGDIPIQDRDNREATYREARAKVASLQSDIAAAERQVLASALQLEEAGVRLKQAQQARANANAVVGQAEAEQLEPDIRMAALEAVRSQVRQAEAKLRTARVNLSYCLIRAPQGGIISRRTIQLGETVTPKQPFLSIVPLDFDNVWVVANLREDQMDRVRAGNSATITLDGIPERTFHGWVESVSGGTGSVFSLFPPDNATGNFVRVVQRLPVRIRFNEPENFQNRIRPGMSAVILIDDARQLRRSDRTW
ncbi:MAG: HlyD family secretion protein [Isosphaeraceae bacterium]|nr:HlyD family secretion protein [Isosphaeraceae bacterium]